MSAGKTEGKSMEYMRAQAKHCVRATAEDYQDRFIMEIREFNLKECQEIDIFIDRIKSNRMAIA